MPVRCSLLILLAVAGCKEPTDDAPPKAPGGGSQEPIGIYQGTGGVLIAPGGDYFDTTADGITPYSFSRHWMFLRNDSDEDITIHSVSATPQGETLDHEWSIIAYGESVPTATEIADLTLAPDETFDFEVYFYPVEAGVRVEQLQVVYNDGETYDITITGRGRDAFGLFDLGESDRHTIHGDPDQDALPGGMDSDDAGTVYYNGNVNGWSDTFSENISVTAMTTDGAVSWSKEWAESYEQLCPDSGQNAETGGGAESIDYDGGAVYVTGHRSQSSSNSVFQTLVMKIGADAGDMEWAVGWSPEAENPPALAWQSSKGYAINASLSDRVIVAGTSFGDAEVSLIALSKDDGSLLWSRQIDVVSGSNDRAHSLAVDHAGNAWIGGISDGAGLLIRVTGVDGSAPDLDFVGQLDMGIGSNINSVDVDSAGNAYLSLDRRGATTFLSAARVDIDHTLVWAKTYDESNSTDQNNTHVVRVEGDSVYVGGRIAVSTADTQYGDAVLLKLATSDGSYHWGSFFYGGKGAEEMTEHRVKGIEFEGGDVELLLQSYTNSLNFEHYWGYWYNLMDDPLADLTLGEDPGDGATVLTDYAVSLSDITPSAAIHAVDGEYNGSNVSTVFVIDTGPIWLAPPASVTVGDARTREGNGGDGDMATMTVVLD